MVHCAILAVLALASTDGLRPHGGERQLPRLKEHLLLRAFLAAGAPAPSLSQTPGRTQKVDPLIWDPSY